MSFRKTHLNFCAISGGSLVRRRFASTVSAGLLKELENRGFVAATTR